MNLKTTHGTGISGKLFLVLMTISLIFIFALGQYFLSNDARQVSQSIEFFFKLGTWSELINKVLVVLVYVIAMSFFLFAHVLDTPLWRTKRTPKDTLTLIDQLRITRNNSHAILLVGILLSGAAFVVMLHGANFHDFLYAVMTRGAIGELLGNLLTVVFARAIGKVKSMDEFKMWVDKKDNDSYAEIIRGLKLAALIIALSL